MHHPGFTPDEQSAIDLYCGGDCDFFVTYRQSCIEAFRADLQTGDRAVAQADPVTLRRVAHSVKGVLVSIGQPGLAKLAAGAEALAAAGDLSGSCEAWRGLRQAMCSAFAELS